jgi:hypothetical protein
MIRGLSINKLLLDLEFVAGKPTFSIIMENIHSRNINPITLNDIVPLMPKFTDWFNRQYIRWVRSQPRAEDFLAFCSLLGYPPETVVDWIEGETIRQGPEVLSIASLFGVKVYQTLDLTEPDEELLKIYKSFSHLSGEYQSRVAHAIWEADVEMKQSQVLPESEEAKAVRTKAFEKWGFNVSGN